MEYNYILIRKNVKRLTIRIKPTLDVVVTAPLNMPLTVINEFVAQKSAWISKHLDEFRLISQTNTPHIQVNLVTGDSLPYLGQMYLLEVIENQKESVEAIGSTIILQVSEPTNYQRKYDILQKWYYMQAKQVFNELIIKYQPIINKPVNHLTIRTMTTRWGSCNPSKGYINLNVRLIQYDLKAIEYVILHELTHLIYRGHDNQFYGYIAQIMPDWKLRSLLLKDCNASMIL